MRFLLELPGVVRPGETLAVPILMDPVPIMGTKDHLLSFDSVPPAMPSFPPLEITHCPVAFVTIIVCGKIRLRL
jgi:hypothetical protein